MERNERRHGEEGKQAGAEAEKKIADQQEPGQAPPRAKGRYTLHREGGAPVLEGPEPEEPPKEKPPPGDPGPGA